MKGETPENETENSGALKMGHWSVKEANEREYFQGDGNKKLSFILTEEYTPNNDIGKSNFNRIRGAEFRICRSQRESKPCLRNSDGPTPSKQKMPPWRRYRS